MREPSRQALPGLGPLADEYADDLVELEVTADGLFRVGRDGVRRIVTPRDRKVELIVFEDKTLAIRPLVAGPPALYPLEPDVLRGPGPRPC